MKKAHPINKLLEFRKLLKSLSTKNNKNAGIRVTNKRGWLAKDKPQIKENRIRILNLTKDDSSCDQLDKRKIKSRVKKIFRV